MRIASLTPGLTEIVCCLGGLEDLVAVSAACDHPAEVGRLQRVGDFESVVVGALTGARPDVVLVGDPRQYAMVQAVAGAGFPVVTVSFTDLVSVLDGIRLVGRAVDRDAEAAVVADNMAFTFKTLKERAAGFRLRPRVFVEANGDPLLACDGWVGDLIDVAGGEDIFPEVRISRTPLGLTDRQVPEAVIRERDPQIHVLAWWGRRDRVDHKAVERRPGWGLTSAVQNERVYVVDDSLFLRPGPRLVQGVRWLQETIRKFNEDEA